MTIERAGDLGQAAEAARLLVGSPASLRRLTASSARDSQRQMRRVVRPGGLVVVTTRDYDGVVLDRPTTTPVQRSRADELRRVTTQLWDWHSGSSVYDVTYLQVREVRPGDWATVAKTTTYRAWTRKELSGLATDAQLLDPEWTALEESRFFQPIMLARR